MLYQLLLSRRDTRHFTADDVPAAVLEKALQAGQLAPSVGLTDATRYYIVRSAEVKAAVKTLFNEYHTRASAQIADNQQKQKYRSLKLEAITDAPVGLVVCYDRAVLNNFTIGTVASNDTLKFSSVCAVQNIWLSLTEQGYSMGWVSILNYYRFKKILNLPDDIEPLGYFCIGKPATDYGLQPMLQQCGWKDKRVTPIVKEINTLKPLPDAVGIPENTVEKNPAIAQALRIIINNKTKPEGSLGVLEQLAMQIGKVFNTVAPQIINPHMVVFAADHGIAQHGVSAYPPEVTRQMVENFLNGGAAINVFCRQNQLQLLVVDAGVNYDFAPGASLINAKVAKGTNSFLTGPAMSASELRLCFDKGAAVAKMVFESGCNTIAFGEMGIGNTSSATVLMCLLTGIPLNECVGRGAGLNNMQMQKKHTVLKTAIDNYTGSGTTEDIMAWFGGFEIMQMAGAMLAAYKLGMLILVDGFICTVAYLCAFKLDKAIRNNAIFCHQSNESGHLALLNYLQVTALLNLGMRLGEGSGCAVAYPIVKSAIAFLNEMASFDSAGVNNQTR